MELQADGAVAKAYSTTSTNSAGLWGNPKPHSDGCGFREEYESPEVRVKIGSDSRRAWTCASATQQKREVTPQSVHAPDREFKVHDSDPATNFHTVFLDGRKPPRPLTAENRRYGMRLINPATLSLIIEAHQGWRRSPHSSRIEDVDLRYPAPEPLKLYCGQDCCRNLTVSGLIHS